MQYFALLVFAALCLVGLVRPAWAFVLLFVMFALEVALQASIGLFRTQGALANVIIASVVGVCVLVTAARQPRPLLGHLAAPLGIILVILGWSLLSLLWSPAEARAHDEGINIIIEGAPYFVVYLLLAPMLLGTVQEWRHTANLMLIGGSLVALSIVLSPEFTIKMGRIGVGLEGVQRTSPLAIGQMGGMLAIFAALSAGGRVTGLQSGVRWAAFIIGALLTLLSGTRGQAIFALIVIALFLPVSRRLKNLGGYFSLVAAAVIVAAGAYVTFTSVIGQADADRWGAGALASGLAVRQWSAVQLLAAFMENPLAWMIGLGYNAFSTLEGAGELGYVHNLFAEVLCELGLPVFVLLILLYVRTGRSCLALFRRYRDHAAERSSIAIIMAMVLYQSLIATKEGNLWSAWLLFTFMLIATRLDIRSAELGDPLLETEPDVDESEESGATSGSQPGPSGSEGPTLANRPPHSAVPAA